MLALTTEVLMLNDIPVDPAGIVTVAGTIAAVEFDVMTTPMPLGPACPWRLIVPLAA